MDYFRDARRRAGQWLHRLAGLALPQQCAVCGRFAGESAVCAACSSALPRAELPCCPHCGDHSPTQDRCGRCLQTPPAFDCAIAPFRYASPVDELIQHFKYGHDLHLGDWLGKAMSETLTGHLQKNPVDAGEAPLLVAIPLHIDRLRERGFNQASVLADCIARRTGLPLRRGALLRNRDTGHQTHLDEHQRHTNLRGAFDCRIALNNATVVLVDDVLTTGATLDAAAKVLRLAGAGKIIALTSARAMRNAPPG